MTKTTFSWLFDGLWSTAAGESTPAPSAAAPAPVVVGRGGKNERQVVIAGEARLFRDEGDVVVQFHPAFDYDLRETPVGMKLIPSLEPHWAVLSEHRGSLRDAIAEAMRAAGPGESEHVSRGQRESGISRHSTMPAQSGPTPLTVENETRAIEAPTTAPTASRGDRPRYGVLKEWGEKTFPDGKRPGKTYESFCLTLEHRGESQVLQGEGLRDAIAEARCRIGDRVEVRRLGKTKVPAVDRHGNPKLDASGAQILWDKWLWSIAKKP